MIQAATDAQKLDQLSGATQQNHDQRLATARYTVLHPIHDEAKSQRHENQQILAKQTSSKCLIRRTMTRVPTMLGLVFVSEHIKRGLAGSSNSRARGLLYRFAGTWIRCQTPHAVAVTPAFLFARLLVTGDSRG